MEPEKKYEPIPTVKETEDALVSAGQRRVNRIWEFTQSYISISVTTTGLLVSAVLTLRLGDTSSAFNLLSNTMFVVIGFYFGRTNHQRTGGVGANPSSDLGR